MKRLATSPRVRRRVLIGIEARGANPPGALDLPPSNVIPAPVDIAPDGPTRVVRSDPSGNPLWAVPTFRADRHARAAAVPALAPRARSGGCRDAGRGACAASPGAGRGAAAADAGRRDRERDRGLRGVPRSGDPTMSSA
jgi:hypothetical protein